MLPLHVRAVLLSKAVLPLHVRALLLSKGMLLLLLLVLLLLLLLGGRGPAARQLLRQLRRQGLLGRCCRGLGQQRPRAETTGGDRRGAGQAAGHTRPRRQMCCWSRRHDKPAPEATRQREAK